MLRNQRAVCVLSVVAALFVAGPAVAGQYVVDQASAAASDDNPGTAEKPLKTISKGVSMAQAGDTVLVKAGTYREEVELTASGTAEKRITLRAAPGERVVVSGADLITGWKKCTKEESRGNPNWEKIYVAEAPWKVSALFQDDRQLKVSRFPKVPKTKYMSQGGDSTHLTDAEHLTQPAGFWEGGQLTVRDASTTNYDSGTITRYDPEKHELVVDKQRRAELEAGKDEYYVKSLVSIIAEPGDWAVDAAKSPCRVYFWPAGDADPNTCRVEGSRRGGRRLVHWADGAGFITIDGLEVACSEGSGIGAWGSDTKRGHDVEILNCIVHHCGRFGVDLGFQDRVTVRHSIVARNGGNGITFSYARDCLVEENICHGNAVDGIVFGWYSNNNRVLRNCVYDQWSMSHPDGIQTFCDVRNFVVQDNLFLNNGQGWQSENTIGSKVTGNMFIGTRGGCLNLSPRSSEYNKGKDKFGPCADFELANNTVAFNGMSNTTILQSFNVHDNVAELMGYRDPKGGFQCDYNLYVSYKEGAAPRPVSAAGKPGDEKAPAVDAHSRIAYPKFRNAPQGRFMLDEKNLKSCEPGKLYLKMTAGDFEVGDLIEINWDGRQRKVTEVGAKYIAFDPPLAFVHPYGWDMVCNWKKNSNFGLDLRLADDSPGRKMGEGGKDVGSKIDIQAYLKGDFNGDGQRDLPPAVKALEYEVHTADE